MLFVRSTQAEPSLSELFGTKLLCSAALSLSGKRCSRRSYQGGFIAEGPEGIGGEWVGKKEGWGERKMSKTTNQTAKSMNDGSGVRTHALSREEEI